MAASDGPKDSKRQRNGTHPYKGEKIQICTTWVNRAPTKSPQDKEAFTVVELNDCESGLPSLHKSTQSIMAFSVN